MNTQELHASAQRIGVEADPRAARPFRLAAVRLSEEQPDTDAHRTAATEAASLLVGLAMANAAEDLGRLLTPDPAETNIIWTVACYQIGDLTPSAIRDFPDPIEAVATLAACAEEAHVAAELVASTPQGLRWTAMLRTNELLSFQLPSPETASDASRERPGDLAAALRRWRERLTDWSAHSGHERDTDAIGFAQLNAIELTDGGVPTAMPAATHASAPAVPSITSVAFNERFSGLEQRLAALEGSISALTVGIESFAQAAQRREESAGQIEQAVDARFRALASFVHTALADLGHNLGERVDGVERRLDSTVRESASDTVGRIREVNGRVSTARRGIEDTVREEIATVLMGLRAGLSPLTNEVVSRVAEMEREVEGQLAERAAELQQSVAIVFEAMASVQRDLEGTADAPAAADDDRT